MKTIDWQKTDALPQLLRPMMPQVLLFVDCTQFTTPERQSPLDPDFKKAVNAIAAFRGVDPIELSGLRSGRSDGMLQGFEAALTARARRRADR
jgi:hypothetical protein